MTADQDSDEFIVVAQRAWQRGLVAGTGGNMSLRRPEGCLIKPTGRANIDCRAEDLLLVDINGNCIAGTGAPSKDVNFHLALYQTRRDVGGVLHTHVPWATAITLLGYDALPTATPHAIEKLGHVPVLPYAPSGSAELCASVVAAFADPTRKAVLLARHGLIAAGSTLTAACEIAELVEETAQISLLVDLASGLPASSDHEKRVDHG